MSIEEIRKLGENGDYNGQADYFLERTNTKIDIEFSKYDKHFKDDNEARCIFDVKLERGAIKYTFKFGQSLSESRKCLHVNRLDQKSFDITKVKKYIRKTTIY